MDGRKKNRTEKKKKRNKGMKKDRDEEKKNENEKEKKNESRKKERLLRNFVTASMPVSVLKRISKLWILERKESFRFFLFFLAI